MKYFYTTLLLILTLQVFSQKVTKLVYTDPGDYVKPGDAIIYGNFIPRHISYMKTGYAQAVALRNIDTKEIFFMETMPSGRTKPSIFSFHLNTGNYEIIYFKWGEVKWYAGIVHTELVYKNVDSADSLAAKIKSGIIKTDTLKHFKFTVTAGNLYYLGTWDFSKGIVSFTNDKPAIDKKIKQDFFIMDFDKAITQLPHTD